MIDDLERQMMNSKAKLRRRRKLLDKTFELRGDFFTKRKGVITHIGERLNFVNGRGIEPVLLL